MDSKRALRGAEPRGPGSCQAAGRTARTAKADRDPWTGMTQVLTELCTTVQIEALSSGTIEQLLDGTSYAAVDAEELRRPMLGSMQSIMRHVLERRLPAATDDDSDLRQMGASRAAKGVQVSDLVRITLLAQQQIVREVMGMSRAQEIPDVIVVESLQYVDAWMSWSTQALIAGHREFELATRIRQNQRRNQAVRRLLSGGLTPVETAEMARDCGLDRRSAYLVVVAPCPPKCVAADIRGALANVGLNMSERGAFTSLYGDLCGIVSELPERSVPFGVGVSSPVSVYNLSDGFRLASRCAEAARRLGRTGFLTARDLSISAALCVDYEVVSILRQKYLDPFVAMGASGESILDTVQGFLENGRSVSAAGHELYAHANTIRYRISRFEEVADCSLRDARTIVEVWWILQARHFLCAWPSTSSRAAASCHFRCPRSPRAACRPAPPCVGADCSGEHLGGLNLIGLNVACIQGPA
jgi:hypothetical protein